MSRTWSLEDNISSKICWLCDGLKFIPEDKLDPEWHLGYGEKAKTQQGMVRCQECNKDA